MVSFDAKPKTFHGKTEENKIKLFYDPVLFMYGAYHVASMLINVEQSHYRPGQTLRVPGG